jgi:hypothetical protein
MTRLASKFNISAFILIVIVVTGCASYYTKSLKLQTTVLEGNMEKANEMLDDSSKDARGRNAILHYCNHGYVTFMLKKWDQSNQCFATADRLIEDQQKNYATEALALMSNPMITPYKPEDFEVVMTSYFSALNYINLNQFEDALVECRRIDIKLNKLNDKYPKNKNRYQRDAFAHLLMGLIYDSRNDYNNAFIAYRNAYEIYETDYAKYFNLKAPEQLKKDILRTAYLTGFYEDLSEYEQKFGFKYDHNESKDASMVFLWLNGFGPVKDEWSINFTTLPGSDGFVTFVNEDMGLSFPFYVGNQNPNERAAFSDLRFLRVAFPKYVERRPYFTNASISIDSDQYNLEMAQNINDIAFKTLHDRMIRDMANSLLRLATKKALEQVVNKQDQNIGAVVGIVNALTEKADTRNWQTLPYSISYTRIHLKEGENQFKLKANAPDGASREFPFSVNAQKGKTYFQSFHNIESMPLGGN